MNVRAEIEKIKKLKNRSNVNEKQVDLLIREIECNEIDVNVLKARTLAYEVKFDEYKMEKMDLKNRYFLYGFLTMVFILAVGEFISRLTF